MNMDLFVWFVHNNPPLRLIFNIGKVLQAAYIFETATLHFQDALLVAIGRRLDQ